MHFHANLTAKALLLDQEMVLFHLKVNLKSQAPNSKVSQPYHISVLSSQQQQGKFLPNFFPTAAPESTGVAAQTHTNKADK